MNILSYKNIVTLRNNAELIKELNLLQPAKVHELKFNGATVIIQDIAKLAQKNMLL